MNSVRIPTIYIHNFINHMKIKVLIIGSEGATGRSISEKLMNEKNIELYRLGRKKSHKVQVENFFFEGDLNDIEFCRSISVNYQFDYIIYVAGIWRGSNKDQISLNENLNPFKNFISTIAKKSKHIVFFSSSAVYNKDSDYCESKIPANLVPSSTYGNAKLQSENILIDFCANQGINFTILRPFHIASPYEKYCRGRSHVVTDFVYESMNDLNSYKKKLNTLPDVWIPFTCSKDVAKLIFSLIHRKNQSDGIYNVGSSETYSLKQLHDCINRILVNQGSEFINYKPKKVTIFDKSVDEFGSYSETQINNLVKAFIDYKSNEVYKN